MLLNIFFPGKIRKKLFITYFLIEKNFGNYLVLKVIFFYFKVARFSFLLKTMTKRSIHILFKIVIQMSKEAMILSKVGNKLQLLLLPAGILETEPVGSFLLELLRKLLSESACIPVGPRSRTSDEAPDCKPVWEPKEKN
jgi:hypothetical protein